MRRLSRSCQKSIRIKRGMQIMVGYYVKTKRPVKHDKLEPTLSEMTFKVIAIKGEKLTLDNGQRWNVA